jgi:hypothetical protein
VDSGGGWLIFAMPPGELAFHPTDDTPTNEIYLRATTWPTRWLVSSPEASSLRRSMKSWGTVTRFEVPGATTIGLYQPKHPTALKRT